VMMSVIRVGIVGAGGNTTAKHIPLLQAIEGVEIVSVCNRSRESSERVAKQFNIPKIYENWQELVNASDTNAIVIGTSPYLHHPIVLASIAAKKHVMTEARLAMNAREAREMEQASKENPDLVCQVVPSPFSLRVDKTIQRMIREGFLGDLLSVEIREGNNFINPQAPMTWRQDTSLSGNNIMSLGIWYEALMRWVGTATGVLASAKIFTKTRKDENGELKEVHVPEHIDVISDMECGAQAHIRISSLTGLGGPPYAAIYGSEGTLKFTQNKLFAGKKGDAELKEVDVRKEEEGHWRVEEEFVEAIRGKGEITHTNFSDGVKYMAFTDAVVESIRTKSFVAVEREIITPKL